MTSVLRGYVRWVRENADNAVSLERVMQMIVRIFTDPQNLITTELAWTISDIHSLSNNVILSTAGKRVTFAERISIIGRVIRELECLMELWLRRYYGHKVTWNVLLVLQSVKCLLNMLIHRQLFLVPWIWDAVRRRLRTALQHVLDIPKYGRQLSSAVSEGLGSAFFDEARNTAATHTSAFSPAFAKPANTPLVIPRVAAPRLHRRTAAGFDGDRRDAAGGGESLKCTALDLLGLVVDLLLLLRPLLLLCYARRVFPRGATDIAMLGPLRAAHDAENKKKKSESSGGTDVNEGDCEFFVVKLALKDGVSKSLLSHWGVWLLFFGLDTVLVLLSRYIRRHRVPIVYINKDDHADGVSWGQFGGTSGGELSSRSDMRDDGSDPAAQQQPWVGNVAGQTSIVSRDSLRLQQALRHFLFSFLRDPFFPAVLQKFLYDHFVVGRINRIPLLGSILGYHVAYFLCKQHYSFMYLMGQ